MPRDAQAGNDPSARQPPKCVLCFSWKWEPYKSIGRGYKSHSAGMEKAVKPPTASGVQVSRCVKSKWAAAAERCKEGKPTLSTSVLVSRCVGSRWAAAERPRRAARRRSGARPQATTCHRRVSSRQATTSRVPGEDATGLHGHGPNRGRRRPVASLLDKLALWKTPIPGAVPP